jgi:hypothetical protein
MHSSCGSLSCGIDPHKVLVALTSLLVEASGEMNTDGGGIRTRWKQEEETIYDGECTCGMLLVRLDGGQVANYTGKYLSNQTRLRRTSALACEVHAKI